MSDLTALIRRDPRGFSRDLRFAPPEDAAPRPLPDDEDEADPLEAAWAAGHAEGASEARNEAEAAESEAAAARQRLAFTFARLDAELAERLRNRLHETVVALCEATLQPLALDREALARRVAAAVALFVRADDERVLRLHPDDLTLVADELPGGWSFIPDPTLDRGALRVETASGGVEDGPVQWRAAIVEALRLC